MPKEGEGKLDLVLFEPATLDFTGSPLRIPDKLSAKTVIIGKDVFIITINLWVHVSRKIVVI